jgi:hypothetical protein
MTRGAGISVLTAVSLPRPSANSAPVLLDGEIVALDADGKPEIATLAYRPTR